MKVKLASLCIMYYFNYTVLLAEQLELTDKYKLSFEHDNWFEAILQGTNFTYPDQLL